MMSEQKLFDAEHFEKAAAGFDVFLPYLQPVTPAVFNRLPDLPPDATVLDIACGTGEPGLALAREYPAIRVIGTDASEGMIALARRKAATEGLDNIRFILAANERLDFEGQRVDAVISRFGFLMYGDPGPSVSSLARMMKPGTPFSFAVWGPMRENTMVRLALEAIAYRLPPEQMPDFAALNALAIEGRREELLREAQFRQIEQEMFDWHYDIPSFRSAWEVISAPAGLGGLLEKLDRDGRTDVEERFSELMAPYCGSAGRYAIPQRCRLLFGKR